MKVLSLICAFIVMTQIVTPCADIALAVGKHMGYTEISPSAIKTHGDIHKDSCTPFCQCACCATPSIAQLCYAINFLYPIHLNPSTEHLPGEILNVSLNIWQPPQLLS